MSLPTVNARAETDRASAAAAPSAWTRTSLERVAESRADAVGRAELIERAPAALRGPDGRFDVRVNDASGQDPLAVAHPRHEPGEPTVTHG